MSTTALASAPLCCYAGDWAYISRDCARSIAPKGQASLLRPVQAKGKDYIAVKTSQHYRDEAETSRTAEMEEFV